jgi:hypothetical protein
MMEVTAPIFSLDRRQRPDVEGSGLMLAIADVYFLITASHVAALREEHSLRIGIAGEVVDLRGDMLQLRQAGVVAGSDDDLVDVSVVVLPQDTTAATDRSAFLSLAEVARRVEDDEGPSFAVAGYPRSRQDRRVRGGNVQSQFHPFLAKVAGPDLYRRVGRSRDQHLVLSYAPPIWNAEGSSGESPSLRGMSGCGMWEVFGSLTQPTRPPVLAAIFTEWRRGTNKYLLGTRIQLVVSMLRDEFPSLRAAIDLSCVD